MGGTNPTGARWTPDTPLRLVCVALCRIVLDCAGLGQERDAVPVPCQTGYCGLQPPRRTHTHTHTPPRFMRAQHLAPVRISTCRHATGHRHLRTHRLLCGASTFERTLQRHGVLVFCCVCAGVALVCRARPDVQEDAPEDVPGRLPLQDVGQVCPLALPLLANHERRVLCRLPCSLPSARTHHRQAASGAGAVSACALVTNTTRFAVTLTPVTNA